MDLIVYPQKSKMSLSKLIDWIDERYKLREFVKPYLDKPVSPHEMSFKFCWGG